MQGTGRENPPAPPPFLGGAAHPVALPGVRAQAYLSGLSARPRRPMSEAPLKYRRVLLKLSGEALLGEKEFGIDPAVLAAYAADVREAVRAGAEVALVIGGGNIFRGISPEGRRMSSRSHRSEEHTSELQSREKLVSRLLLEKKKKRKKKNHKK